MKTITINLYTYDELSEEAKEKARQWYTEGEYPWYDWHDCETDYWAEELKTKGFNNAEISFSGFYSQGDGASYSCDVDMVTYMKINKLCNRFRLLYDNMQTDWIEREIGTCKRGWSHYYTEYTFDDRVSIYIEDNDKADKAEEQLKELIGMIKDEHYDLSQEIYHSLRKTYESMFEQEYVEEGILANEYTFLENGKRHD